VVVSYLGKLQARIDKEMVAAKKRRADLAKPPTPRSATDVDLQPLISALGAARPQPRRPSCLDSVRSFVGQSSGNDEPEEVLLDREVRKGLGPVARAVLVRGHVGGDPFMPVRDEHVEILCRFVYLPAFLTLLLVFVSQLPTLPQQSRLLADACRST
jgi:hypothetical protein